MKKLKIVLLLFITTIGFSQKLIIVEQDFDRASKLAIQEDKLLFIDFYTTWCGPCKKLDKWIFQNDTISQKLANDFVLLRYDAEKDTISHLSKKHHVSSYPTGLILNRNGYVLNRKYGFSGQDLQSLSKNVLEFASEGIRLNKENKILKGYSNEIDASKYPRFYVDYINRTNTKINTSEVNDYLISAKDIFSEQYFSTLLYFAREASDNIANITLENRDKYLALYGKTDLGTLLYFLTSGKFKRAISEKDQIKYDESIVFAKAGLSKKWTDSILPSFEKDFLKAQNKWSEVLGINKILKNKGEFDNGYINHFSWQVYEDCDNQQVIRECLKWMKDVTDVEPTYSYLDTYAHLMYKSGNKKETRSIALLAIEVGEKEDEKTKSMEELIKKL